MRMSVVSSACGVLMSNLLGSMGYHITSGEWWAAMGLMIAFGANLAIR